MAESTAVAVRLSQDLMQQVAEFQSEEGLSQSDAMRILVEAGLRARYETVDWTSLKSIQANADGKAVLEVYRVTAIVLKELGYEQ